MRRHDDDEFETWVESALERADPLHGVAGRPLALVVGYELAFLFERDAPDGVFSSFGDAFSLAGSVGAFFVEDTREREPATGDDGAPSL